jgi:hypothetical protein
VSIPTPRSPTGRVAPSRFNPQASRFRCSNRSGWHLPSGEGWLAAGPRAQPARSSRPRCHRLRSLQSPRVGRECISTTQSNSPAHGRSAASPQESRPGRVGSLSLVPSLRSWWWRGGIRSDRSSGEPALGRTCLMGKAWPKTQHPKSSTRNAAPKTNRR